MHVFYFKKLRMVDSNANDIRFSSYLKISKIFKEYRSEVSGKQACDTMFSNDLYKI